MILGRDFYDRPTLDVARDLLGKILRHRTADGLAAGRIVEVEAYIGEDDPACHAAPGPTIRNAPLYGPPGVAYVYLNYGLHHMVNAVTEAKGHPAAVLIRALEPVEGLELMRVRRGRLKWRLGKPAPPDHELCRGPGNLTAALGITLAQNQSAADARTARHRRLRAIARRPSSGAHASGFPSEPNTCGAARWLAARSVSRAKSA